MTVNYDSNSYNYDESTVTFDGVVSHTVTADAALGAGVVSAVASVSNLVSATLIRLEILTQFRLVV